MKTKINNAFFMLLTLATIISLLSCIVVLFQLLFFGVNELTKEICNVFISFGFFIGITHILVGIYKHLKQKNKCLNK